MQFLSWHFCAGSGIFQRTRAHQTSRGRAVVFGLLDFHRGCDFLSAKVRPNENFAFSPVRIRVRSMPAPEQLLRQGDSRWRIKR